MTQRSLQFDVDLPDLVPGAPTSISRIELPPRGADGVLALADAWLLRWLPDSRGDVDLAVGRRWSRLDPHVDARWRIVSRALAETEAERCGARLVDVEDFGALSAPHGLAVENRSLAARLAASLGDEELQRLAPALLPALHPVALGLDADATAVGLGVLRDACRGLPSPESIDAEFEKFVEFPRRVKAIQLGNEEFGLSWSRSKGLRWRPGTERAAEDALALEVQGDVGARGEFVAGLPARARRYLASDFRPVRKAQVGARSCLVLERELKIPENPIEPHGRKRPHDVTIVVGVDVEARAIDFEIAIRGLLPEHRYRICVPMPFWPRPSRFESHETTGAIAEEGPRPLGAVAGRIEFDGPSTRLALVGSDLVEAELYERRNDVVCSATLARVPHGAPGELRRRFRLESLPGTEDARGEG